MQTATRAIDRPALHPKGRTADEVASAKAKKPGTSRMAEIGRLGGLEHGRRLRERRQQRQAAPPPEAPPPSPETPPPANR